jgi:hypothetical protein
MAVGWKNVSILLASNGEDGQLPHTSKKIPVWFFLAKWAYKLELLVLFHLLVLILVCSEGFVVRDTLDLMILNICSQLEGNLVSGLHHLGRQDLLYLLER